MIPANRLFRMLCFVLAGAGIVNSIAEGQRGWNLIGVWNLIAVGVFLVWLGRWVAGFMSDLGDR